MVQQNMFPRDVSSGKQSQSATGKPQASQSASNANRPSGAAQNRSTQFHQTTNENRNAAAPSQHFSESRPNNHVRLLGRIGRYFELKRRRGL